MCRVWQGTVLDIAVDLSALPYLLRLILALTEGASPVGRSRSAPTVSVGEELQAEVRRIPSQKRRSESDDIPSLARPSGQRSDRSPGLSLGIWAGPGGACCRYAVCWPELLL